jgi:hypothetical protein
MGVYSNVYSNFAVLNPAAFVSAMINLVTFIIGVGPASFSDFVFLEAPAAGAIIWPKRASKVVCWVRTPAVGAPFGAVAVEALQLQRRRPNIRCNMD